MTGTEAANIIGNRLGQRTGLNTQTLAEMALCQTRLEGAEHLPWFLQTFVTNMVTVAGTKTVALPTGFIRLVEEGGFWLVDADGKDQYLTKDDYDALRVDSDLAETGQPTHYAIVGSSIYLFPTPDAVYTLKMHYYQKAAAVTGGAENSWLANAADLLIAETGLVMARFLRDEAGIALFGADRNEARTRLLHADVARDEAGKQPTMGG